MNAVEIEAALSRLWTNHHNVPLLPLYGASIAALLKTVGGGVHMRYICGTKPRGRSYGMQDRTLNVRVPPELKELIRLAAYREHRTLANLVDVLVRKHCGEQGIQVQQKQPRSR